MANTSNKLLLQVVSEFHPQETYTFSLLKVVYCNIQSPCGFSDTIFEVLLVNHLTFATKLSVR